MSCLERSAWSSVLLGQTCSGTWVTLGISACSWWCWNVPMADIHPLELFHNYMSLSCPQFFLDYVLLDPFYPAYTHLFCHLKCISSSLLFTAFRFCRMLSFLTQITAKPYKIHNLSCIYIYKYFLHSFLFYWHISSIHPRQSGIDMPEPAILFHLCCVQLDHQLPRR